MQPLDGVFPVLHVAATPIALDEPLVRLAVARRPADVRREHRDAAREQVLVERLVERLLLRLGPAVNRQDDRHLAVGLGAIEPGRNLTPVEAGIAHELDVDEVVFVQPAHAAVGDRVGLAGGGLDDPGLGRPSRSRENQSCVRAVWRQRERRLCTGQVRARTGRQVRLRKIAPGLEVTKTQAVVAVVVHEPGEYSSIGRRGDVIDVVRRLFDPFVAVRCEVVERKPAELAPRVREHVEAGAVRCPRAGKEDRVVIVRRQLARFPGLEVDQVNRGVAVVPEVERQQLRTVRGELAREGEHALAEDRPRLAARDVPNPDLHVGRVARVRRVGELRPVGCPGGPADVVLDLRLVGQLVRPTTVAVEHVELMKLVSVVVCAQQDPAVRRRHSGAAHGLVGECGQLVRPTAFDGNAPEIELPGHVAREQQLRPVGGERQHR